MGKRLYVGMIAGGVIGIAAIVGIPKVISLFKPADLPTTIETIEQKLSTDLGEFSFIGGVGYRVPEFIPNEYLHTIEQKLETEEKLESSKPMSNDRKEYFARIHMLCASQYSLRGNVNKAHLHFDAAGHFYEDLPEGLTQRILINSTKDYALDTFDADNFEIGKSAEEHMERFAWTISDRGCRGPMPLPDYHVEALERILEKFKHKSTDNDFTDDFKREVALLFSVQASQYALRGDLKNAMPNLEAADGYYQGLPEGNVNPEIARRIFQCSLSNELMFDRSVNKNPETDNWLKAREFIEEYGHMADELSFAQYAQVSMDGFESLIIAYRNLKLLQSLNPGFTYQKGREIKNEILLTRRTFPSEDELFQLADQLGINYQLGISAENFSDFGIQPEEWRSKQQQILEEMEKNPNLYANQNEEFLKLIANGNTVVIFSAEWCGWCKELEKDVPSYRKKFPNIQFVVIDVDNDPRFSRIDDLLSVSGDLGVSSHEIGLPTIFVYKSGHIFGSGEFTGTYFGYGGRRETCTVTSERIDRRGTETNKYDCFNRDNMETTPYTNSQIFGKPKVLFEDVLLDLGKPN